MGEGEKSLKNLSHISSHTRLIKNIFEDMHADKKWKNLIYEFLFLTENIQMISKCISLSA